MSILPTDEELLDFLDSLSGQYTDKVVLRMSAHGRGWRLHETSLDNASLTVREAIRKFMSK